MLEGYSAQRRVELGHELRRRRIRLGYTKRPAFAKATGLSISLIQALENADRPNFASSTLDLIEVGYQLPLGRVLAFMNGEQDTLVDSEPQQLADDLESLAAEVVRRLRAAG